MAIQVSSSVIFGGNKYMCPICGGKKGSKAEVCGRCKKDYEQEWKIAIGSLLYVQSMLERIDQINVGSGRLMGPVVANILLKFVSEFKVQKPPYYFFKMPVAGGKGYINCFIYNAFDPDKGEIIGALIELRAYKNENGLLPFLRIIKIHNVKSDAKLIDRHFGNTDDMLLGLPYINIGGESHFKGRNWEFSLGFAHNDTFEE